VETLILGVELVVIILLVILGAAFGSFFNVVIYRVPRKESIVFPSSHCPHCGKAIPFWLNVPILSYLLLKGKCKYCGAGIHWHYFLVELLTPLVFLAVFFSLQSLGWLVVLKYLVFFGIGVCIFFIDAFHQIIPDVLSLPLIVIGLIFSLFPGADISFQSSLVGGLICFLFFLLLGLLYYGFKKKEGMGGGDVKLIAAVGTFFGFPDALFVIVLSAILAVVVILAFQKDKSKVFPYGPFIIAAALLHIVVGAHIMDAYLQMLSSL